MQGHGLISHLVKMHYFFKNLLLYSQALIRQTKYVVMMTKVGSTKIVNFMTLGAVVHVLGRGHISHIVKLHNFFNNLLLYTPRHRSNKLSVCYSNDDQGRVYQNCKFHISHYSEYVLRYLLLYQYTSHLLLLC